MVVRQSDIPRAVPQRKDLEKDNEPHAPPGDKVLEAGDGLMMDTSQPEELQAWPAIISNLHGRLVEGQIWPATLSPSRRLVSFSEP